MECNGQSGKWYSNRLSPRPLSQGQHPCDVRILFWGWLWLVMGVMITHLWFWLTSTGASPQKLAWDLTSLLLKYHAKSNGHISVTLFSVTLFWDSYFCVQFAFNSRLFNGLFLPRMTLLLHLNYDISIWCLNLVSSSISIWFSVKKVQHNFKEEFLSVNSLQKKD